MNDAIRLGDAQSLKDLQARLAERGVQPYEGDLPTSETPEEYAERMKARHAGAVARWERQRPLMYADAQVAHLDAVDQSSQTLAAWVKNPEALNLILAGPVGTGKTYAAYALGNLLIQGNRTVEAWTVPDLLEAMRPGGDETATRFARRADVLVLDDLGAAKPTEWAQEQMTALLDARLREQRRTIVTTNLTEPQVAEFWGGRFMDRLRHQSTAVVMRGESRRTPAW